MQEQSVNNTWTLRKAKDVAGFSWQQGTGIDSKIDFIRQAWFQRQNHPVVIADWRLDHVHVVRNSLGVLDEVKRRYDCIMDDILKQNSENLEVQLTIVCYSGIIVLSLESWFYSVLISAPLPYYICYKKIVELWIFLNHKGFVKSSL